MEHIEKRINDIEWKVFQLKLYINSHYLNSEEYSNYMTERSDLKKELRKIHQSQKRKEKLLKINKTI